MNTMNLSKMKSSKSDTAKSQNSIKPEFPDWREIIDALIIELESRQESKNSNIKSVCYEHIGVLNQIRGLIKTDLNKFHVGVAFQLASRVQCSPNPSNSLENSLALLENSSLNSNEFFSIYDLAIGEHIYVHDKVKDVLGINPDKFKTTAFFGMDPEVNLYYEHDILHILRFATMVYQVLSIPGLEFKALQDFHQARFRVNVANSEIKELREMGHIMLEKRTYWITEKSLKDDSAGRHLLYRWSIYHPTQFNGIEHYFVTDLVRSRFMQDFSYLFNAYSLGISPKFILMLDARTKFDRNKAIAAAINEDIKRYAGINVELDEGQVADCFAKTIRPKVAEAINIWEKRLISLVIHSDIEAVYYATRLGLLPIPARIKELIYRNITEI